MCPPIWAHLRHLENMTELVLPSVHPSPQPKRQISRFSHPFPQNCRFSWGIWTLSDSWLGHSEPTIQTAAISVQPFSHRWTQSVTILHNGTPLSSLKIVHSHGGSGPHQIHGSLGSPESSTQMASPSVQPFLHSSLVWQTDRPSDRPTDHAIRSVTIDRTYVK